MKKYSVLIMFVLLSMMLSSCYWNKQIESNEVGLVLSDGVNVSSVNGPGRYSAGGWYSELQPIDTSIKTSEWQDTSLVTSDNQPIGLKLSISYRRSSNSDMIKGMFVNYRKEALSDDEFMKLVMSRLPDVAKNATAQRTLNTMLKERSSLANSIQTEFTDELKAIYGELVTVQILDIAIDPEYEAKLKQKAQVILDRDIAKESVTTAEQNFLKTKAETEIQLELARRQNLINQEMAKTFELNSRYFELERLKLLSTIIGDNDKLIFVPAGSSLNIIESMSDEKIVPVEAQ